jgi:fumarate hydratase class II
MNFIGYLQTGSGTQSNMNVNEVVVTPSTKVLLLVKETISKPMMMNKSQSSNDTFPTGIIATLQISE